MDRYRNHYIGKEGVDKKHLLTFNDITGRYSSNAFTGEMIMGMDVGGTTLTHMEIDELYYVFDKEGNCVNLNINI